MIFKIQQSEFSSDGKKRLLFYNEDRSIREEFTLDEDIILQMMGDKPKVYMEAEVKVIPGTPVRRAITFEKEVEDQDW